MTELAKRRTPLRPTVAVAIALLGGCVAPSSAPTTLDDRFSRWARYEAEPGATHFSALSQINRSNVQELQVAWTYDKGGANFNPIVIDSVMYALGANGSLVALGATSGRELWTLEMPGGAAGGGGPGGGGGVRRGVMYWESSDRSDRRIFVTRNNAMFAVDAATGRQIMNFGTNGFVDIRQGITSRDTSRIQTTPSSPGVIFEDIIILGNRPGEQYNAGPGDVRAFDARTGRFLWVFHTIPHPGEFGYDSWKDADAYTRIGAANPWGGMSVDEKRGIVYIPLGSASYDFYGADRLGNNLFANSLVALDARTGKRLWHFQTVHHDLWDYDLTATPTLLTVRHNGQMRDIVAQATKHGYVFVFDRVTGEPLWPIEERPVPASDMPGEVAAPTQPVPTWPRPFAVQRFSLDDINPFLPRSERDSIRTRLGTILNLQETIFQPPSTRPTMQMPGNTGGANWGSTAADPRNGSFFVLTKNVPTVLTLEPVRAGTAGNSVPAADRGLLSYAQNCRICHQANLEGQPPLVPSLVGVTDRLTPEQITSVVHQGRGNMPGYPDMSTLEVNNLITYLRNPAVATPISPQAPTSEGDPTVPVRFQTAYGYYTASGGQWAIKPPWMTLTKYDMNTGEIAWQVPIGDVPSLAARGITGTGAAQITGGPSITGGDLVFVSLGSAFGALDSGTGKLLWSYPLTGGGANGIPTVYQVNGRQYVTISATVPPPGGAAPAAGQGQGQGNPPKYITFALPANLSGR